ncbi:Trafficking protein particle complex subunit 2-like protein, partial [Mucuna pruriens]
MIVCVAVVGHQNNPLYIQSFTEADDALKLHHIVHCSLDVVDERVNNPKKSGPMLNETFLGLLYPIENYKVYGYLTNTKVKFILVTTDLDVKDADVRNFFRRFHAAYVDAVSNPFHVPGKKITSRTFAERVSTIVKSFGFSSAGFSSVFDNYVLALDYIPIFATQTLSLCVSWGALVSLWIGYSKVSSSYLHHILNEDSIK